MKKSTLILLCCSAFLYACDSSNDAASDAGEKTASVPDKEKESVSSKVDAVKDAATEVMVEAKELKDTALESAGAAVDSASESVSEAVTAAKDISSTVATKTSDLIASVGTDDAKLGESIYKGKCIACHGTGAAGAPKLGDKTAWGPRIAQGNAVLTLHAIEGFKSDTGYMPPKGGFMSLSDEEISLTVQYMVSQSQ
jgi:cytochrome c5